MLRNVLEGVHDDAEPRFAYRCGDGGVTEVAALRTPPWGLLVSELAPAQAAPFLARWLQDDPDLPGVSALPQTARAIAAAWSAHTGRATSCRMREAMHALREVRDPPRPAPGRLRPPEPSEYVLLVDWMRAFADEARIAGAAAARRMVDVRLARDALLVWDDDGPVAMAGTAGWAVGGVMRIGPVYTPPERRRRGYAGAAVAAISRRALAGGARTCMLFTDLANATSNKIYAEVGYRRIAGWEEHSFDLD